MNSVTSFVEKFNVIRKARASFLVLAVLVLLCCFSDRAFAADGDMTSNYEWWPAGSVEDLPKTGDRDVFSDKDWFPLMIEGMDSKYDRTFLAGGIILGSSSPIYQRPAQVEPLHIRNANYCPYPYNLDMEIFKSLSNYGALYAKYAGQNPNGRDVYFLKTSGADQLLISVINGNHVPSLALIERKYLKANVSDYVPNSTMDHWDGHNDCWYDGLFTWEFVEETGRTDIFSFSVRSGAIKYKTVIKEKHSEDTYYYRGEEEPMGMYTTVDYYIRAYSTDKAASYIQMKDKGQRTYFSLHYAKEGKTSIVSQPMTIGSGRTYRLASTSGLSVVNHGADITVNDGGVLIMEGDVLLGGNLVVNEGGTVIVTSGSTVMDLYPGMDENGAEPPMFIKGSLIIMPRAVFSYCGNDYKDYVIQSAGCIQNYGVLVTGKSQFWFRDDSKLENEGAFGIGLTYGSNTHGLADYYDQNMLVMDYPNLYQQLQKCRPNLLYIEEFLKPAQYSILMLEERAVIRNYGEFYFAKTNSEFSAEKNCKWLGSGWTTKPADSYYPSDMFIPNKTWN